MHVGLGIGLRNCSVFGFNSGRAALDPWGLISLISQIEHNGSNCLPHRSSSFTSLPQLRYARANSQRRLYQDAGARKHQHAKAQARCQGQGQGHLRLAGRGRLGQAAVRCDRQDQRL